jgi:hypothetical protein
MLMAEGANGAWPRRPTRASNSRFIFVGRVGHAPEQRGAQRLASLQEPLTSPENDQRTF